MTVDQNERRAVSTKVIALCKAAAKVRGGTWISGAPTHILPDVLAALEDDGWHLSRGPVSLADDQVEQAAKAIHRADQERLSPYRRTAWDSDECGRDVYRDEARIVLAALGVVPGATDDRLREAVIEWVAAIDAVEAVEHGFTSETGNAEMLEALTAPVRRRSSAEKAVHAALVLVREGDERNNDER